MPLNPVLKRILHLDAHHRFVLGMGAALTTFAFAFGTPWPVRLLLAWNAFAFIIFALCWVIMIFGDARTSVRQARIQDSSRTTIFIFVNLAALASLLAVILLLRSAHGGSSTVQAQAALLAGVTIILSWLLTHTVYALHYAHIYYQKDDEAPERADGEGLKFPGGKRPHFLDFAYFSFVIGMTCQVSDVQVTSPRVRRTALVHGLLSFVFNTIILAWSINLAAGLIK